MNRRSTQEVERYYFTRFREHFSLPSGLIEYRDKPDVRIHGGCLLGIEIANLYLTDGADPASEQVQSLKREKTVQEAQRLYLDAGGKSIELTVSFDPTRPITNIGAAGRSLAIVASSIHDFAKGPLPRKIFERVPQINFIYYNPCEYRDARWRVTQSFSVPTLSIERVAELVAAKERLLPQYERCDAYWLLLVVDFMNPAQDQEIGWPLAEPALDTRFERVILYKPQLACWTEVPVAQKDN